jgi:hypothetical protein
MLVVLLISALSADTWTPLPVTAPEAILVNNYLESKEHLIFPELTRNLESQKGEIRSSGNVKIVRLNETIRPDEVLITLQIAATDKVSIQRIEPEYFHDILDAFRFHDPDSIEPELLRQVLASLKEFDGYSGTVQVLFEYRTRITRGTEVHLVFYDTDGVMNSVIYVNEVGTNPSHVQRHLSDKT